MNKTSFLKLAALKTGIVNYRGEDLHIRQLSAAEASRIQKLVQEDDALSANRFAVLCGLQDGKGKPMFGEDEDDQVAGLPSDAINTIAKAVYDLDNEDGEDEADETKNS